MATSSEFNSGMADRWCNEVTDLNEEADSVLKLMTEALKELKTVGTGPIAEAFYQKAEEMTGKFADLVSSLRSLVEALRNVIQSFVSFVSEVVELVSPTAKMLGL